MSGPNAGYLVQGSGPVFKSKKYHSTDFFCKDCNNLLIEGYREECFIGVNIKCSNCGAFTRTPPLSEGEILPNSTICYGEDGGYLIKGTVEYSGNSAITTDKQIVEISEKLSPKVINDKININIDNLEWAINTYCNLVGTTTDDLHKLSQKYEANNHSWLHELPFYWAYKVLRENIVAGNTVFTHEQIKLAVSRVALFTKVHRQWGHHPRYREVVADLKNSRNGFYHTIGQLATAAWLYQAGNVIGFYKNVDKAAASPDLYIRVRADESFFIECKAPSKLVFANFQSPIDEKQIEKTVKSKIKSSSQINKSRIGLFVIFCSGFYGEGKVLNHQINKRLERKSGNNKYVAGVLGAVLNYDNIAFTPHSNPHFFREDYPLTWGNRK